MTLAACDTDPDASDGAAGSAGIAGSSASGAPAGGAGVGGAGAAGMSAGGSHAGTGLGGSSAGAAGAPPAAGSAGADGGAAGSPGAGGAGAGDGSVETCLDAPVIGGARTEALSFVGDGVAVGLVRRVDPDGVGTSGTTIWLPQRFALVRGSVAECISSEASLSYQITHHNFDDSMSATSGAETWTVTHAQLDYDKPQTWNVVAKQGQNVVWGPVGLSLTSCWRLDNQQDCTAAYQP